MKIDKDQDKKWNTRDARLLSRAQAGDKEAFSELWEHYRSFLHAAAFRKAKRIHKLKATGQVFEKAEDMVNETFLLVWKKINEIPPHVTFRMWLWGTLRNVIRGQVSLFERPFPFDPSTLQCITDEREGPSVYAEDKDSGNVLRKYISRLEEKYRVVLEGYYFRKMTQAEVGKEIGRSREIVRRRIGCAVHKLKDILEANRLKFEDF